MCLVTNLEFLGCLVVHIYSLVLVIIRDLFLKQLLVKMAFAIVFSFRPNISLLVLLCPLRTSVHRS